MRPRAPTRSRSSVKAVRCGTTPRRLLPGSSGASRSGAGDIARARVAGGLRPSDRPGARGFGLGLLADWLRRTRRSADRGRRAALGALVADRGMSQSRRAGAFRPRREPRRTTQYAIEYGAWRGALSDEGLLPGDASGLYKRLWDRRETPRCGLSPARTLGSVWRLDHERPKSGGTAAC